MRQILLVVIGVAAALAGLALIVVGVRSRRRAR